MTQLRTLLKLFLNTALLLLALTWLGTQTVWAQPVISSANPNVKIAGGSSFTLLVFGSGFNAESTVVWHYGSPAAVRLDTQMSNANLLSATVPSDLIATTGAIPVTVVQKTAIGVSVANMTTVNVIRRIPPVITSQCPLPTAGPDIDYGFPLTAVGGAPEYTWTVTSGTLPLGFVLRPDGFLIGKTSAAGNYDFEVTVTDSEQYFSAKACSISVDAGVPTTPIINGLFPSKVVAGSGPVQLTISGTGFDLSGGINITGSPGFPHAVVNTVLAEITVPAELFAAPGMLRTSLTQSPNGTPVTSNEVILEVVSDLKLDTACPMPPATLGSDYSTVLTPSGGIAPFYWLVKQGALPDGLDLDYETGVVSGKTRQSGLFNFTLGVSDSRGISYSQSCSLKVQDWMYLSKASVNLTATPVTPVVRDAIGTICPSRNVPCTFKAVTTGGAWLKATPSSTQTGSLIQIEADGRGLAPGNYSGGVLLTTTDALNTSTLLPVTLSVTAPVSAKLKPSAAFIQAAVARNTTTTLRRTLLISNEGSGNLDYSTTVQAVSGGDFVTVSPATGSAGNGVTGKIIISIRPGLTPGPGTYQARVRLTSSAGTLVVPVVLAVSDSTNQVQLPQIGLTRSMIAGGPAPLATSLQVLAGGTNSFPWTATKTLVAGGSWLNMSPGTGTTPSQVNLSFNTTNLSPDILFGEVKVAAASGGSSRLASVALQVLPWNTYPGTEISTTGLVFTATPNGANPARQEIVVRNGANQEITLDHLLNGSSSIWSVGGTERVVPPGQTRKLSVGPNVAGLTAGTYRATVAVSSSGDAQVHLVDLLLVVAGSGSSCTATRLIPVLSSHANGFYVPGGLPQALEVKLVDDCGRPMTGGSVAVSTSTGAPWPVALTHVGNGQWSGTWQVAETSAAPVTLTIRADDPDSNLSGSADITGNVSATTGIPVVPDGSVVSSASGATGGPLANGSIVSVYGTRLAFGNHSADYLPLPEVLGPTKMFIAGTTIPLFLATDNGTSSQVNGMLPFGLTPNHSHQLSVLNGSRRSNYVDVNLAFSQPAAFTVDQSGSGQGVVVDAQNPTKLANSANPVARGGYITIYMEGLGPVTPEVPAGDAVPASPLHQTVSTVTAMVGGVNAPVLFSGLVPGMTGMYQVNVQVPENITPGNEVPVTVISGNVSSPEFTIAVK